MKKNYITLQKGLEIMLEYSQDNPRNEEKAKFMAQWIKEFFKEKRVK